MITELTFDRVCLFFGVLLGFIGGFFVGKGFGAKPEKEKA